jgi:hypothetical protein
VDDRPVPITWVMPKKLSPTEEQLAALAALVADLMVRVEVLESQVNRTEE